MAASLQPWKFPGAARNRGDSGVVTLKRAGIARGKRDSPEHPHGSRAGCFVLEAWRQRNSGKARRYGTGEGMAATFQCPSSLLAPGGGSASAASVVSLGTEQGMEELGGLEAVTAKTQGWGGCVGCRHTLPASLAVHGVSLCPRVLLGACHPPPAHGSEPDAASRALQRKGSVRRGQRARGPREGTGAAPGAGGDGWPCRGCSGRRWQCECRCRAGEGAACGADVFVLTAAASRCSERSSAGAARHPGGLGAGGGSPKGRVLWSRAVHGL